MVWNGTKWTEQNGTDTIRSSITTITTKQAEFETNLNGLTSSVSSVTKKVETVESDLSAAESTILSMQTDISTLQQTATEISADVSKKADAEYGSETSSFGWKLKSNGFYLYSNATTVMSVTSNKLTVSGEIVATSGTLSELTVIGKLYFGNNKSYYIGPNYNNGAWYIYLKNFRVDETNAYFSGNLSAPTGNIGGFTLSSASLYTSGKTIYNSTTAGVYIGTNGIGLGAGTFYVTSAGKLYASDAEISGTITATSGTIGGFTIGESSLSNASGGSSIEITSGDYQTKLGANYIYSRVYSSAGSKGWSLSLDEFTISAYVSSVYAGIYMNKYKKELFHLWGKVGLIVNLSQMIEYTLANVLAFDETLREFEDRESMYVYEYNEFAERAEKLYKELEKKPLGFGIEKARQLGYFNDKSQEWLKAMCEERNFVVHRLFREDLVAKHLETDPTFYYDRLENLIEEMNAVNNNLNEIFAKQKAEYKLIW